MIRLEHFNYAQLLTPGWAFLLGWVSLISYLWIKHG